MARIRTIKPEFFRHEGLQDLEQDNPGSYVMLVFAGLWGHCDKLGRFEWKPRTLKLDILPFLSFDMATTMGLLLGAGFLRKYVAEDGREYGEVNSFEKHQRINGKEAQEDGKFPDPVEYRTGSDCEAPVKQARSQEWKGKEEEREEEGKGKGNEALRARREQVAAVFAHWRQIMNHPKAVLDDKRRKLIESRLKDGYSADDLCSAITGCSMSPFHMGQNEQGTRYDGLELILRDGSKIDKFLATFRSPPRPLGKQGQIEARNQAAVDEFLGSSASVIGDVGPIFEMEGNHG